MDDENVASPPDRPQRSRKSPSGSFLVRFWVEPSADAPVIRGSVRNLQTGEEQYVGAPEGLGEVVLRQLKPDDDKPQT